jgi:hypothetical protein
VRDDGKHVCNTQEASLHVDFHVGSWQTGAKLSNLHRVRGYKPHIYSETASDARDDTEAADFIAAHTRIDHDVI